MATFHYTAVKLADKSKSEGTINAETEREARELLRQQELYPTSVKLLAVDNQRSNAAAASDRKKKQQSQFNMMIAEKLSKIGMQEKITFTQNLEIMVRAGIPITEALLYMESYMDNLKFKRLVNTIRLDILAGFSFSRALAKHKQIFNDVYVSIVQAGEASGELEAVLKRLADLLTAQAKLRKKVIGALIYPAMVIVIVVIVLLIMFLFVLPTFSDMYSKMGVTLPLITKIMIGISNFLRNFWYIALAMAIGGGFGLMKYLKTKAGKGMLDRTLLKLPVVSPLVRSVAASHFISTLHVSFTAGLPITDCMGMACKTVTHTTIREAFDTVNYKIQAGNRLAASLADSEVLPGMVLIMISSGEEAGNLEEMLVHSLDYLEGEVNQRVEVLMSMMEPVLLIVLGVIVGCMALSIYLPLFGMYEHVR